MQSANGRQTTATTTTMKSRLASLILAIALACSCLVVTPQSAFAMDTTDVTSADSVGGLYDAPTWQDIYAWYIFAGGTGEGRDGLSGKTIDYIASSRQSAIEEKGYGMSNSLNSGVAVQPNIGRFGTTVKTLVAYGYLQMQSRSDNPALAFLGDLVNSFLGKVAEFCVNDAMVGAGIYDGVRGICDALRDGVLQLNVLNIFGLNDDASYSSMTLENAPKDGTLESLVAGLLINAGITQNLVIVIARLTLGFVIGMFGITLVIAFFNGKQGRRQLTRSRSWALRIVVIMFSIPISIMLSDIAGELADDLDEHVADSVEAIDNSYVVNVLDFAAYSNFDMTLIGGKTPNAKSEVDTNFYPSAENIKALNTSLADLRYGSTDDADVSAQERMAQLLHGDTVTVADYLSELSTISITGVSKTAISRIDATTTVPALGDEEVTVNAIANPSSSGSPLSNPAYWLTTIDPDYIPTEEQISKMTSVDSGTIKNMEEALESAKQALQKCEGDAAVAETLGCDAEQASVNKMQSALDAAKKKESSGDGITYGTTGPTMKTYSEELKPDGSWKMQVQEVALNDPSTYIYGAVSAGANTEQSRKAGNFIWTGSDANTSQTYDPRADEPFEEDSELQKDGFKNAIRHALVNRYAGTKSGGFSTQSMVFLLQTTVDRKSWAIDYQGYQTAPNDEGSGKNAGAGGASFVKYVIPNSGSADLLYKLSQLNFIWFTAGIASIMALLALVRAPLLTALWRSATGFFKGLFTGDIFGLIEYVVYYIAIVTAFMLVDLAITAGVWMASLIPQIEALVGAPPGAEAFEIAMDIIPGGMIVMTIIVAFILTFPIIETGAMRKNGKPRKLNLIAAIVMIPFLLAEAICSNFDQYRQQLYGSSGGRGVAGALKRSARGVSAGETLKKRALATGAATLGVGALAVGGAAAAGGAGVKGIVGAAKTAAAGQTGTLAKFGAGAKAAATQPLKGALGGAKAVASGIARGGIPTSPEDLLKRSTDGTVLGALKSTAAMGTSLVDGKDGVVKNVAAGLMGDRTLGDAAAYRATYEAREKDRLQNDELDKAKAAADAAKAPNDKHVESDEMSSDIATADERVAGATQRVDNATQEVGDQTQNADNAKISVDTAQIEQDDAMFEAERLAAVNAGRAAQADSFEEVMPRDAAERAAEEGLSAERAEELGRAAMKGAREELDRNGMSGMMGFDNTDYAALQEAQMEAAGIDTSAYSQTELAAMGRKAALDNEAAARASAQYRATYGDATREEMLADPEYARMLNEQRSALGLTGDDATDIANQRAAVNAGESLTVDSITADKIDTDGIEGDMNAEIERETDGKIGADNVAMAHQIGKAVGDQDLNVNVSNTEEMGADGAKIDAPNTTVEIGDAEVMAQNTAGDVAGQAAAGNTPRDLPTTANVDGIEVVANDADVETTGGDTVIDSSVTDIDTAESTTNASQSTTDASMSSVNTSNADLQANDMRSQSSTQHAVIDNSTSTSNNTTSYNQSTHSHVNEVHADAANAQMTATNGQTTTSGPVTASGQVASAAPAQTYGTAPTREMGGGSNRDGAVSQQRVQAQVDILRNVREQVNQDVHQNVSRTTTEAVSRRVSTTHADTYLQNFQQSVSQIPGTSTPSVPTAPTQAPSAPIQPTQAPPATWDGQQLSGGVSGGNTPNSPLDGAAPGKRA